MKASEAYVLEKCDEADRLEYQSQFPKYNLKQEFKDFKPKDNETILDAGSGSGILSRYFAEKNESVFVTGVDYSEERVGEAKKRASNLSNIAFEQGDLRSLRFGDQTFNSAISRYVVEHIPKAEIQKVMSEIFRVLKPGGSFYCCDFDGPVFNLFPQTPIIQRVLSSLSSSPNLDLWVGRKIPFLMEEAGFDVINWRIETVECRDEYMKHELELLPDKFDRISSWVDESCGKGIGQQFKKEYINILKKKGTVLFYNKFIVIGKKPSHVKEV